MSEGRRVNFECPNCKHIIQLIVESPYGLRDLHKCKHCAIEHVVSVTFEPQVKLIEVPVLVPAKVFSS